MPEAATGVQADPSLEMNGKGQTLIGTLGYETFKQLDDTADDHLDSLLECLIMLESKSDVPVSADIITWRGMITKVRLRTICHNKSDTNRLCRHHLTISTSTPASLYDENHVELL